VRYAELDIHHIRILLVVAGSKLPTVFLLLSGKFSHSRKAQYWIFTFEFLLLVFVAGFAHWDIGVQELGVATLVMVSFDMFQHALDARSANESDHRLRASSAAETLVQLSCAASPVSGESKPATVPSQDTSSPTLPNSASEIPNVKPVATGANEGIVRLQTALIELKTANKAKELLLRRTREELKTARETLNGTFGEYCSLRDEMKNIKQNMARDHQAIVYRKDIELFALRKGNEQKEKHIKEHDAKLEEIHQEQKATVEMKDSQLKLLKERLAFLERQADPKFGEDQNDEGDHALKVRLLRVKTDNNKTVFESPSVDEKKDATIVSLREQLAVTRKAADEVVNQQAELARAWDVVKNVQASLKEERKLHEQTREKLQELNVKYEEQQRRSSSPTGRLPTIEEDKDELEAMFDSTQQDNLRLYAELQALEQRLRDANSRMFNAEQQATVLREQMQTEQAVSEDLSTARPSVVHRVHFQRMEGELKEVCDSHLCVAMDRANAISQSRDALAAKADEIKDLKTIIAGKNDYIKDLQAEVDAAVSFHTQDQDEIERLKQNLAELQATKEHLMRDHERAAIQRPRIRVASTEHTSARSSGVTLIQEASPPLPKTSSEAPVVEALPSIPIFNDATRNGSIQTTPKRHLRSESTPNRWHLMSNTAPPPELRGTRRRSLGLKDFMKRMVKKDDKENADPEAEQTKEQDAIEAPKQRPALASRNLNASVRPQTAAPTGLKTMADPFVDVPSVSVPHGFRPANVRVSTPPRYYPAQEAKEEPRPQTAAESKDDLTTRSVKRRSWGAAT
jgi:chromosome segregation ATPase